MATELSTAVAGSQVRGSLPRWKLESFFYYAVSVSVRASRVRVLRIDVHDV